MIADRPTAWRLPCKEKMNENERNSKLFANMHLKNMENIRYTKRQAIEYARNKLGMSWDNNRQRLLFYEYFEEYLKEKKALGYTYLPTYSEKINSKQTFTEDDFLNERNYLMTKDKIREILEEYARQSGAEGYFEGIHQNQAISQILQVFKECVGEDYPIVESLITKRKIWMKGYNQAKKEIRLKLED